jgi:hypothetical protein
LGADSGTIPEPLPEEFVPPTVDEGQYEDCSNSKVICHESCDDIYANIPLPGNADLGCQAHTWVTCFDWNTQENTEKLNLLNDYSSIPTDGETYLGVSYLMETDGASTPTISMLDMLPVVYDSSSGVSGNYASNAIDYVHDQAQAPNLRPDRFDDVQSDNVRTRTQSSGTDYWNGATAFAEYQWTPYQAEYPRFATLGACFTQDFAQGNRDVMTFDQYKDALIDDSGAFDGSEEGPITDATLFSVVPDLADTLSVNTFIPIGDSNAGCGQVTCFSDNDLTKGFTY